MTNGWHIGKFGDVLVPISRPVQVEPDKVYRNLGVQWYAKGLFIRGEKPGHEILAKELYRVELGDLVYNRLFAWKGSFAIAEKNAIGGFVSGEFPCFRVDTERADAKFLHLYLSQEKIWEEIERTSSGQTNISRLRLKEPVFLNMDIPIPPLNEQRRIVAFVESLAARISKAQSLREEAKIEIDALIDSILSNLFEENKSNWAYGTISEFAEVNPSRKGQIILKGEDLVSFVPMRAVDDITGTIARAEPRSYDEVGKGYTWFQNGDVIFARITPCMENGKSAIAKNLINGTAFGSTEFHVLRPRNIILAEWLHILVRSKQFRNDAATLFKGTAGQQRVPQSFLDNKIIPVPPLDEQRRIVAYLDNVQARLASLRELQSATGEELDALLPSVLDKAFKGEL